MATVTPRLMSDRYDTLARSAGRDRDDVLEYWSERAAIREYDGGMTRAAAEGRAWADVIEHFEGVRR
jgi:hypothetical protein